MKFEKGKNLKWMTVVDDRKKVIIVEGIVRDCQNLREGGRKVIVLIVRTSGSSSLKEGALVKLSASRLKRGIRWLKHTQKQSAKNAEKRAAARMHNVEDPRRIKTPRNVRVFSVSEIEAWASANNCSVSPQVYSPTVH